MNHLVLLRTSAILALTLFAASSAHARIWTRASDNKQLKAEFVRIDNGKIVLSIAGKEYPIPSDQLIKADQEAAQRFAVLGDDSMTQESAKRIDMLLAKNLAQEGVRSFNEPLPDDLFVRRVYLDIIGRIPTREEFLNFVESPREDKRTALIDDLLMHPGYASHMFNYFGDMFRLHADADFAQGVRMEPYIHWWKEQLRNNRPYDEMVVDMVTATGNVGQNPASGFLLRDAGMEFDAFSNFGQVMLGIDISCAQCHDHPFDEWTMDDFYGMAAYFGQTQRTARTGGMMMGSYGMPNAPENWNAEMNQYASRNGIRMDDQQNSRQYRYYINFLGWNLYDNDDLEIPIPSNITEMAGETPRPSTFIGGPAQTGKGRRVGMADWLVSDENPRFAHTITNRMWQRAFGRAFVEPVNDFPVEWEKVTKQPETFAYLAKEMRRIDYDLREFMRIIYNTKAYQTLATPEEPTTEPYIFTGPVLRRMRAEQTWDSLMVLAHGSEVDNVQGRDGSLIRSLLNVDFENESIESIFERYKVYESLRGARLGAAVVSEPGSLDYTLASLPESNGLVMARASEMEQPSSGATLLDTFGQSDRIITDEHTYDGSVPQVLALMNGTVTDRLTGSNSKLVTELEELDAPEDKVRGVYFTLLSRYPTNEEQQLGVAMLEDYGDDGIRDLAWALMNSPEFLFVQ